MGRAMQSGSSTMRTVCNARAGKQDAGERAAMDDLFLQRLAVLRAYLRDPDDQQARAAHDAEFVVWY